MNQDRKIKMHTNIDSGVFSAAFGGRHSQKWNRGNILVVALNIGISMMNNIVHNAPHISICTNDIKRVSNKLIYPF